jgi:outer membrane protein OmpA-like peptidoglycan-associated protein
LKDDGISPIRTGQKSPTCINLKADTLFDLHKWNIRDESADALNALKIQLKKMGQIEGISITGYSDSIPQRIQIIGLVTASCRIRQALVVNAIHLSQRK